MSYTLSPLNDFNWPLRSVPPKYLKITDASYPIEGNQLQGLIFYLLSNQKAQVLLYQISRSHGSPRSWLAALQPILYHVRISHTHNKTVQQQALLTCISKYIWKYICYSSEVYTSVKAHISAPKLDQWVSADYSTRILLMFMNKTIYVCMYVWRLSGRSTTLLNYHSCYH